jgi:hypothetical protein
MQEEQDRRTWKFGYPLIDCGDRATASVLSKARQSWANTMADYGKLPRQEKTASHLVQRTGTRQEKANTSQCTSGGATLPLLKRSNARSATTQYWSDANHVVSACTAWGAERRFVRAVPSIGRYRENESRHGISQTWLLETALHPAVHSDMRRGLLHH